MSIKLINRVVDYIEENLNREIVLDELADLTGMSKSHLHLRISEVTGEKLIDYIKKRRLTKAAFELLDTKRPVIDIALDNGYSSQEAFTRAFKKVFSLTPKKYREYGYDNIDSIKTKLDKRLYFRDDSPSIKKLDELTLIGVEEITNSEDYKKSFDMYHKIYNLITKHQYLLKEIKIYEYFKVIDYKDEGGGTFSIITQDFVGVEYNPHLEIPKGFKTLKIDPNSYAVFSYRGSSENLGKSISNIYNNKLSQLGLVSKDYSTIKIHDERVYGHLFNKNRRVLDRYIYESEDEYFRNLKRSSCTLFSENFEVDIYITIE